MDDWKVKVFEDFKISGAALLIALLAGTCRTMLSEDKRTLFTYIRGLTLGITTALALSPLLEDQGVTGGLKILIVAVASFTADDLLMSLLKLGRMLREDPRGFITMVINIIRGKK